MARFEGRRTNGRWSFRAQGCCGNLAAWEREYTLAFAEQTLRNGGHSETAGDGTATLVDRKGRCHSIERSVAALVATERRRAATSVETPG